MKVKRRKRVTLVGLVNFKRAQRRTEIRVADCGKRRIKSIEGLKFIRNFYLPFGHFKGLW